MNRTSAFRPVLAPVDFSEYSAAAALWAARLCERLGAPLTLLHVVHDPAAAPGYYRRATRDGEPSRIDEAAAEMMADFVRRLRDSAPESEILRGVEPTLVVGLPVTRILEVAHEIDAAMIVLGSMGRTGLPHLLLGSKALRVAQLAPMPVTIVKADEDSSVRP